MVRWGDLGEGFAASPRILLRLDLWLGVLRRALFSRVFLGYLVTGAVLFFVARAAFNGMQGSTGSMMVAMVVGMVAGPLLLLLLGVGLLPYAYWAFNPIAARLLQDRLDLPPPAYEEPPFGTYLYRTWPVLGAVIVSIVLGVASALLRSQVLASVLYVAGAAVVILSVMKLFSRTALWTYYGEVDTERFLRATRWQRVLAWLPVTVVIGLLVQWLLALVLQVPALAWVMGGAGIGVRGIGLTVATWVLAQILVSAALAIAFIGALLLGCGRLPSEPGTASTVSGMPSVTMPYDRMPVRQAAPARPAAARVPSRPNWALRGALAFAVAAGALYLARLPIADWYVSRDAAYRERPAVLAGLLQPSFAHDPTVGRLTAAYVRAGCNGDVQRMQWLRRIGLDTAWADQVVLACAACGGQGQVVQRLLQDVPALQPDAITLPAQGAQRRRNALSCAVERNDIGLVKALVERGARPAALGWKEAPVHVAAEQQQWTIVSLLLRGQRGAAADADAIFTALDAARAQGPQKPAELLPLMLEAGLSVDARDPQQRTVFHWAALRHDLPLARALVQRANQFHATTRDTPDWQGAQPWMYVLRKAELDGQPLAGDAAELLRLLVPSNVDLQAAVKRAPDGRQRDALPEGWTARTILLNDPLAREVLGNALDVGRLPADPASWWKFRSAEAAEGFVRTASLTQLMRAENPDAPAGLEPRKLTTALEEAGWPQLARDVKLALEGRKR